MITRKRLAAGVCALLAALTAGIAFPVAAVAGEPTGGSAPQVDPAVSRNASGIGAASARAFAAASCTRSSARVGSRASERAKRATSPAGNARRPVDVASLNTHELQRPLQALEQRVVGIAFVLAFHPLSV